MKVSDWNSFRVNQNYSDSFRYLYPSQCESFRTNPKNVLYLVWWKTVKRSDLIRFNPRQLSEWIRNQVFNPDQSDLGFVRIDSDWKFGLDQSELGLIRIANLVSDWFRFIRIDVSELVGLSRMDFWSFFIKLYTKRFSDWFVIIRIGSDTDIGMNRNSSDWLGMNSNPILSRGMFFSIPSKVFLTCLCIKKTHWLSIECKGIFIATLDSWINILSRKSREKALVLVLSSFAGLI